jgi:porin
MGNQPKHVICIMVALFASGCATSRDMASFDQPGRFESVLGAGRAGSLSLAPDVNIRAQSGDATLDQTRGLADASTGPIGPGWVDHNVVFARWPEQGPGATAENPSSPAGPSAPSGMAGASSLGPTVPASPTPGAPITAPGATGAGGGDAAAPAGDQGTPPPANAVSGNPAATNIVAGTGRLGEILGINRNGIRVGGLQINDANGNLVGGLGPGKWTGGTLTIADLSIDLEKFAGWKGGLFGTEFLYFNGFGPGFSINNRVQGKNDPNALAGTVMGFNSLSAAPPFSRTELYELWFRQEFFDKKLIVRIGKSVPTYDFNNVVKAIPLRDQQASIPAISSAIFTPLYVNPTILGVIPGYYNSATGITVSWIPTDNTYFNYGFYDGNLARGEQTGFDGPRFNGYYLHMVEGGTNWRLGEEKKPGKFGAGAWFQTGKFKAFDGQPLEGANGIYLFGSQRLYYENFEVSNNGLISWMQFGATNSDIVRTHRYFGVGLTYFGPLPSRDEDSCGFGLAYGEMTGDANAGAVFFQGDNLRTNRLGPSETILTWYYQMKIRDGIFIQPNLSYIPDPAQHPGIPGAFDFTMRAIVLF